jgi:site-specific recombinase XerD
MQQLTIAEVRDKMLAELSGVVRASKNTLDAYTRDINEFLSFCSEKDIHIFSKITIKTLRKFIIKLNEDKLAKSSISRKLSALRRLFLFAVQNNIVEISPLAKIPNPKVIRKLPETVNVASYLEIYSFVRGKNDYNDACKIISIFELLYGCALRVSELCSLNVGDIDFYSMSIRIFGKGEKMRIVPLGSKSAEVLKEYLQILSIKNSNQPLFTDDFNKRLDRHHIYKIVNKYLSLVTHIEKRSPHILRHSAATHMLDNNADIMAVKEILGHENLSTTQIYTHVSIERLKQAYKKAHPKSEKEPV